MNATLEMTADLRQHLALCREIFALVQEERQLLSQPGAAESLFPVYRAKKNLLPGLDASLDQLRKHRSRWKQLSEAQRAQEPENEKLMRENQDLIMKIILLDRENEQALLRRGLVPARELPSVNTQRPHFVAGLYQRASALHPPV